MRSGIRRGRVSIGLVAAASVCALGLSLVSAHAYTPQNNPQPEPFVPAFDGRVTEADRMIGLQPHRRLGPIGNLGQLAVSNIQSEMSIAVAGDTIILGANDFRGSTSVSGVFRSVDGGNTFTDGGQLPIGSGQNVFGDPVLAVWTPPAGGPSVFYYASIFRNSLARQTLCVHRSTDGGATWQGPFEVSVANVSGRSADKEWITVDKETGRLFCSWTDFPTSGTNSMRVTYSDDQGVTWSPYATYGSNGQGSCVAADPNSGDVYVVWYSSGKTNVVRSPDNGATWGAAVIADTYTNVIPPYGFDRYNSYPSCTVSPTNGDLYIVHAGSNNGFTNGDLQDVRFIKSSDHGATFAPAVYLNAFPGNDRPQVFPTVACASNGRVDVFWYDQSCGTGNDDWTDLFYTWSTDAGANWSSPVPVNSTPWHNESGNNFSAPHQGDYIDAAGAQGSLNAYATSAGFADVNPFSTAADPLGTLVQDLGQVVPLRIRPGAVTFTDQGCGANDGFLVAGEVATLAIPLQNIGRTAVTGISATLTAITAGVSITNGSSTYADVLSGATTSNSLPFVVSLAPGFPCGQDVKLHLDIAAAGMASTYQEFTLRTGVVASTTTLLSENFDALTLPNVPAGWSRINGCSTCPALNWRSVVDATAPSQPNACFATDSTKTTFGRLYATTLAVPAGTTYLDVDFDIKYDTEVQDSRLAFDAASFEYAVDGSASHFASADAIDMSLRYDHYVTRNTGGTSQGDRQGWGGSSGGWKHSHLRIPGMAGHTFTPRFSMASDASAATQGVWIDNVVINAVTMGCGNCVTTDAQGVIEEAPDSKSTLSLRATGRNPFLGGTTIAYTLSRNAQVSVEVYNLAGQKVRTLANGPQNAGAHALPFTLKAAGNSTLPAGVYVIRMTVGGASHAIRVTALR